MARTFGLASPPRILLALGLIGFIIAYPRRASGRRGITRRFISALQDLNKGLWRETHSVDKELIALCRDELKKVSTHPGAIRVDAHDGTVVLSGPVLASERDAVLVRIRSMNGVKDVMDRLEPHEAPGRVAALQGRHEPGQGT